MLNKETLKSRTFWVAIGWGVLQGLHGAGVITGTVFEVINNVLIATGVITHRDAISKIKQ